MKKENIKEFIALVERYETISLAEIQRKWNIKSYKRGSLIAASLTGFGSADTCTLCVAVHDACFKCVYGITPSGGFGCLNIGNLPSYKKISNAETPEDLFNAYKNRAKHLRKRYKKLFVPYNITKKLKSKL